MQIPSTQFFTHIHSHSRSAEHLATGSGEKPEEILIARLVADLMVWTDSAWIIGLIQSHGAVDVVGVFGGLVNPAVWTDYVESISLCTLAGTLACVDLQ